MPLSIILPAKNEALALPALPAKPREHRPEAELIVVDDDPADNTTVTNSGEGDCQVAGITIK